MRVALNRPAQVRIETRNYDGDLTAPTGNVAVTVRDIDDTIVQTGNATASSTDGIYTFELSASTVLDTLGVYTLTAAYTISAQSYTNTITIEVVGNHIFEIHELRAFDVNLADAELYTPEMIRAARDSATERLEESAQVALTTRRRSLIIDGSGNARLLVPDTEVTGFISASHLIEDTGADTEDNFTATEIIDVEATTAGLLVRTDGNIWEAGVRNYVVEYEHGLNPTPAPFKRAAMLLAYEALIPSSLSPRATSQSTDLGEFRLSVANIDAGRYTGIPEVDAIINEFGRRRPSVG